MFMKSGRLEFSKWDMSFCGREKLPWQHGELADTRQCNLIIGFCYSEDLWNEAFSLLVF